MQRHVKIFFATDIHGSEKCYRKFLNAGKFYGVEVLILGGDVTGKALVPITKLRDGTYKATVNGRDEVVHQDGLPDVVSSIRNAGLYPYIGTAEEIEELANDKERLRRVFENTVRASLSDWMQLAEDRAKPYGIEVYIQPGNDDEPSVLESMSSDFVVNPEGKLVFIRDSVPMISYGYSNRTPWNSPRELDEDQLTVEIEKMAVRLSSFDLAVFNFHVPPKDATIDRAPVLGSDLKPVVRAGEIQMAGAGSIAVRNAIQKYQPLLSLHGHIHESGGMAKIGRTIAINPGSEYSDGILRGALLTIDTRKMLVHYQLTTG
jgi:Icc-related predicted phosphoesterase